MINDKLWILALLHALDEPRILKLTSRVSNFSFPELTHWYHDANFIFVRKLSNAPLAIS